MELGIGWPRAPAQGYSYPCSCIKIKLTCNFQMNLKSWGVNSSWGLDSCARLRQLTITFVVKFIWGVVFKRDL